eukprot:CAMPEP_0173159526 /NCGR_PEP_ID=MMETSP1105-20130129/17184_1 /TAXON_ID=2985 /ORGANISM="Ochromonas sp., Strain BG-1" /LENGTH=665 /DNA_ID=CAMNT_0014078021 /DNA_START=81 /DNA_END=2078 /DNA_ORIENTATION=-
MNWKDIRFETLVKDASKSTPLKTVYKTKVVLNNLTGRAESGQLLAILGPTGCGKTSLMNVLSARFPGGGSSVFRLSGSITVNGKTRDEEKFRKISAYVLQDDNMYAFLTVFETLMLSAHFFLPEDLSDADKTKIVDTTIAELGLVKARDTIIGNEKVRGVSGGERKRASIGVQLLTDPAVLFLDEPTSGLDAFQSQAVMESLKNLADNGRLVITVIHQPRSSIYEMFDKLLILSEGRTMYTGGATEAVDYFGSLGYTCPDAFNPADYFLDLLSPDNRSKDSEEETSNRINFLGQKWLEYSVSSKHSELNKDVLDEDFRSVQLIGSANTWKKTIRNTSLLFWRSFVQQARDIPTTMGKIIPCIFFSLLIGGIYSNIGNSQNSIMNRKGVLYFLLINQSFISVTAVIASFPLEKQIVGRERSGRAYSTLSYCMAKVLVELPINIFPILVYCCVLAPLVGLNPHTFGYFILICMLNSCVIIALGMVVSALAPNVDAANALSAPFLIIGILFGGFYIKIDSLPIILNWIPYISAFRWSFQALCINEFKGQSFSCNLTPTSQCLYTGEDVLATMDFDGHTTSYPVFGLGMLWIAYLVWLYLLLEFNRYSFLPLGYTGWRFKAFGDSSPSAKSYEAINQPSPSSKPASERTYELVPTAVNEENEGKNDLVM